LLVVVAVLVTEVVPVVLVDTDQMFLGNLLVVVL
jgi:hypothetical protein